MTTPRLTIIDTGCANLTSVVNAFTHLNADVTVSADYEAIKTADKLILPGVGTAAAAMKALNDRGFPEIIRSCRQPFLGICLGMQMLSLFSEEAMHEGTDKIDCLGLIDAKVRLMKTGDLRLPHMGWNQVEHDGRDPIFYGIPSGSYFYYVHSYAMEVNASTIAQTTYGETFSAVVRRGNFYGAQFHPEKSGSVGSRLLKNFLELC